MSADKSKATRLADAIQPGPYALSQHSEDCGNAAAELRRLDSVNRELLEALQGMVKEFGFDVVHPQGLVHDEAHAIQRAMDAIAKATDV